MSIQIIWNGVDEYSIADELPDAKLPEWPVCDSSGHWHHKEFEGQRVVFAKPDGVYLGFMVDEIPESEIVIDEEGDLTLPNDVLVIPVKAGFKYFRIIN